MITHMYTSRDGALVGKSGVYEGSIIKITRNSTLTLGRDPKKCNVVISENNERVSRVHCHVSYDLIDNVYIIVDESTHGTIIQQGQNRVLIKGQSLNAHSGDVICLGDTKNCFELL